MRPYRFLFISVGAILVASYLSIALLAPYSEASLISRGYFIGSLYAHTFLAAVWAVLGPARLKYRWSLSLLWMLSLPFAFVPGVENGGPPFDFVAVIVCYLLGNWLLLQILLFAVVWRFGLRIGHTSDAIGVAGKGRSQFMIGDLMFLMLISGCVFGIGRTLVPFVSMSGEFLSVCIFLSLATIILNLPLILAALMEHVTIVSVFMSIGFFAVASYFELLVMKALGVAVPTPALPIAITASSSALIVGLALVVRLNGFRLFVHRKTNEDLALS